MSKQKANKELSEEDLDRLEARAVRFARGGENGNATRLVPAEQLLELVRSHKHVSEERWVWVFDSITHGHLLDDANARLAAMRATMGQVASPEVEARGSEFAARWRKAIAKKSIADDDRAMRDTFDEYGDEIRGHLDLPESEVPDLPAHPNPGEIFFDVLGNGYVILSVDGDLVHVRPLSADPREFETAEFLVYMTPRAPAP